MKRIVPFALTCLAVLLGGFAAPQPLSAQSDRSYARSGASNVYTAQAERTIWRGWRGYNAIRVYVYLPANAHDIRYFAFMRNEIWGGAQSPRKPNTDDMGTTHYMRCPVGRGECPIGWAKVDRPRFERLRDGLIAVSAWFHNWYRRNDRWGKLVVRYRLR